MVRIPSHRLIAVTLLVAAALVLAGCGFLPGSGPEPTPTLQQEEARAVVPTFTPTPEGQEPPTATPPPPVEPPAQQAAPAAEVTATGSLTVAFPLTATTAVTGGAAVTGSAPLTEAAPSTETAAAAPAPAKPKAVVSQPIINVRQGPGTNYKTVGSANQGTELDVIGKNQAGDWWQVCCVNGEIGWVFNQIVTVSNVEGVAVSPDIPAPPVAAAPAPVQPAPAPEQPQPEPTAPPEQPQPEPQPAADGDAGPCGGDDGCKFKIRGGPSFGANGGGELKMEFAFVHGGRGDEAQGSYFVVLKKDGQRLPVPDSVRSSTGAKSQGQLGEYNYQFSLPAGSLPGGTVAGGYTVWVLDGNGERDSEVFNFTIPDGQQGLLWIKFDQN